MTSSKNTAEPLRLTLSSVLSSPHFLFKMVPPPFPPKTRAPREIAVLKNKSHRYLRERNLARQSPRNSKRRGGVIVTMKLVRRLRRGATGGGNEAEADVIEEIDWQNQL